MSKYHVIMGKRVSAAEHDTDHLMRLMFHISKRCNKFALKHIRSMKAEDGGVWVARCFVSTIKTPNGKGELATIGETPLEAAEKLLTMLDEHQERSN